MTKDIETYFADGCGRCSLFATPQCKINFWRKELKLLRSMLLECGLSEEMKWGSPVYTIQNKNVIMIGAFKENCVISFFKGVLLNDEAKILTQQGEDSQVWRIIRFTNIDQILSIESTLKSYIYEAIEIEKAGLKVELKKIEDRTIPEELQAKFDENPAFQSVFKSLTPGRQRSWLIHFSQPKQSATRISRIEKSMEKIYEGKGFHD